LLAEGLGCNRLTISSDSTEVIEAMKSDMHDAANAAAIFNDCYFMSREFVKASFKHENREANTIAHDLAQLVKYNDSSTWIDVPPPSIVSLLVNDVTLFSNKYRDTFDCQKKKKEAMRENNAW